MTEPVAWFRYQQGSRVYYDSKKWDDCQPLYTAPPQRTWVGLTDDEYFALQMKIKAPMISVQDYIDAMRMVEAKLKEKNT